VRRPADGAVLHADTQTYNQLITDLRAPTERAHALLGHWPALERITVCPKRIGTIAAALVFTSIQRGRCDLVNPDRHGGALLGVIRGSVFGGRAAAKS
jgi:hypothetical protein